MNTPEQLGDQSLERSNPTLKDGEVFLNNLSEVCRRGERDRALQMLREAGDYKEQQFRALSAEEAYKLINNWHAACSIYMNEIGLAKAEESVAE